MSWITAILQLYSKVADLFGNVIVKRINIRLFDLLARFHYILNLPRMWSIGPKFELIQDHIVFLVTCKNEEDPIKNQSTRLLTSL